MDNITAIQKQPVINQEVPAKHMDIRLTRAQETVLLGSRGSMKTSIGIALYMIDMVHEMPRSTGVGVALSYEHLDKNTMDPLIMGLRNMGFIQGEHFVLNKRPPDHWQKAYLGVEDNKYDRTMVWYNGTIIRFVSLARKAAANAVSAQWGFFDEAKFMDPEDLKEIFPIFRGNEEYFSKKSCYLSKFFATDKLADPAEINWLLNKRNLVDTEKLADIRVVQAHVNILKARYFCEQMGINAKKSLAREIQLLEQKLNKDRQDTVYVAEINCYDVLPLLGIQWLKSAKRNCKNEHIWKVAYENRDPDRPGEAFYPSYDDNKHLYDTQDDIDSSKPLIISCDYQHSVSPIPICQIATLPDHDKPTLNFVDEVYTIYPEGLRGAVKKLCDRYASHRTKEIFYCYDHTAIGRQNENDEHYKKVVNELEDNGWIVYQVDTGQAPGHYQKYLDTIDWMDGKNDDDLQIKINKVRCPKLHKSIAGSPAKTTNGKTEKDKKYENTTKYPGLDQSETTHFSDAFDMILDAVNKQKLIADVFDTSGFGFR